MCLFSVEHITYSVLLEAVIGMDRGILKKISTDFHPENAVTQQCYCVNEPVIFSHLKLGHRFHALIMTILSL